jgi:hypothetical protein
MLGRLIGWWVGCQIDHISENNEVSAALRCAVLRQAGRKILNLLKTA